MERTVGDDKGVVAGNGLVGDGVCEVDCQKDRVLVGGFPVGDVGGFEKEAGVVE